jgi:hypothetical protein
MNRFWKLLNWEINRFSKLYAVILLTTLVLQFVGVLSYSFGFMTRANNLMNERYLSVSQYVVNYGRTNFEQITNNSLWFVAPIALGAVTLLLYVFLIWYKEWFGKNTFVYRLFMLPTSRMNIYLAKLGAIFLFVLGLAAFQLFILHLQMQTFNVIVSSELRDSVSLIELISRNIILRVLFPTHFIEFLFYYSMGATAIIVAFTLILLERSFRIKGIIMGIGYVGSMVFLVLLPLLIYQLWIKNYFYPSEVFWAVVAFMILIASGSLGFSAFLLNKKVTV